MQKISASKEKNIHRGSGFVFHPQRDWLILVAASVALCVAGLAYDAWIYHDAASGAMYVSVPLAHEATTLHLSDLETVAGDFASRTAAVKNMKVAPLVDPSQ